VPRATKLPAGQAGGELLCGTLIMARPSEAHIQIDEIGPQKFTLVVIFAGQRFECGSYISRAAAQQAGRLFVARKQGEQEGRKKNPRKR
jgi:hypothetical protein